MSGRRGEKVQVVDQIEQLEDDMLEKLYSWVDELPLSRPKKNMARDFSDGVLVAEILKKYFPKQVEMHNYSAASATDKKANNWNVLNRKVLKKLNLEISQKVIKALVDCKPNAAETVLSLLREHIDLHLAQQIYQNDPMNSHWMSPSSDRPEADQNRGNFSGGYQQSFGAMTDAHPPPGLPHPPMPGGSNKPPWFGNTGPPPGGRHGDMLPKQVLNEKERDLQVKTETIEILQAKIQRLEHLLHLKDIRIEDLSAKVDSLERQFAGKPAGRGMGRGVTPQHPVLPNRAPVPHAYHPPMQPTAQW